MLSIYSSVSGPTNFMNALINNIPLEIGNIKHSSLQTSVGSYSFTKVIVKGAQMAVRATQTTL